jgi:hypothetical protein
MENLPDMSETLSQVMKHYAEQIKGKYPKTPFDFDKHVMAFTRAWIELQINNALLLYYAWKRKQNKD